MMISKLGKNNFFKMVLIDEYNKPLAKIKETNPAKLKEKALSILDKIL